MASIVAKMNAAAEERNRKFGNKLEPGQLRPATPSEAAYVKATDPMVQRGEQQSSQQAAEQEARQVAPAQEKPEPSQEKPAEEEPLNKEQAAYNALQAKAEQDLQDEAEEQRK